MQQLCCWFEVRYKALLAASGKICLCFRFSWKSPAGCQADGGSSTSNSQRYTRQARATVRGNVFHQHRAFVYTSKSQLKTLVISLPFQWIPVFIKYVINHKFPLLFHTGLPVFIIGCTCFIACLHLSRNPWIWKNFLFTATHKTFWNLRRFISNFHNIYVIHPLKAMCNSREPHKIQYARGTLLKSSTGPQNPTVCMK